MTSNLRSNSDIWGQMRSRVKTDPKKKISIIKNPYKHVLMLSLVMISNLFTTRVYLTSKDSANCYQIALIYENSSNKKTDTTGLFLIFSICKYVIFIMIGCFCEKYLPFKGLLIFVRGYSVRARLRYQNRELFKLHGNEQIYR